MELKMMTDQTPAIVVQKRAKIWSSRKECQVSVRIVYRMHEEENCTIYYLEQVEELEKPD